MSIAQGKQNMFIKWIKVLDFFYMESQTKEFSKGKNIITVKNPFFNQTSYIQLTLPFRHPQIDHNAESPVKNNQYRKSYGYTIYRSNGYTQNVIQQIHLVILIKIYMIQYQEEDEQSSSTQSLVSKENCNRYQKQPIEQVVEPRNLIGAPREIPKQSYSLLPDMITGWKPKRKQRSNDQNVFPLSFANDVNDEIVAQLSRRKMKYSIVYLGPRKLNSYLLHEGRNYQNPYPIEKKLEGFFPERPSLKKTLKKGQQKLIFNSDFECGNLDMAISVGENEFDLLMRVDSNTKGHTNWYYFEVENNDYVGSVKFNLCNFRRQKSLYQRGMKPYVQSEKQGGEWEQKGSNVTYERKKLRYKFLYDDDDQSSNYNLLYTYFTLTFEYEFKIPNDKVKFAYCIPYSYSNLLSLVREVSSLQNVKYQTGWRTLSGLPVPLFQITDFSEPNYNKKVVLITARIHPGESNSSHVCEGLIRRLVEDDPKDVLKRYHFYIIPMLNPDGVVAGNYRTSLFGKDLNRTFNQARKFAFPETFHLVEFAKGLKKQFKQRFIIYIDLHGHSVKKNAFFYGPDYNLAHSLYNQCRQFPKILGNLTPMFRYYSCIFRITTEKSTTARATLNRLINIPFAYTMESSNGSFYESSELTQRVFDSAKWKKLGEFLVKGFELWVQKSDSPNRRNRKVNIDLDSDEQEQKRILTKDPPGAEKISDDEISEGKSDSEPENQDLKEDELQFLEEEIAGKKIVQQAEPEEKRSESPTKTDRLPNKLERDNLDWSKDLRKSANNASTKNQKKSNLPPINFQINKASFMSQKSTKKRLFIEEGLKNLTGVQSQPPPKPKKKLDISQLLMQMKRQPLVIQETKIVLVRKHSRQEIIENARKYK